MKVVFIKLSVFKGILMLSATARNEKIMFSPLSLSIRLSYVSFSQSLSLWLTPLSLPSISPRCLRLWTSNLRFFSFALGACSYSALFFALRLLARQHKKALAPTCAYLCVCTCQEVSSKQCWGLASFLAEPDPTLNFHAGLDSTIHGRPNFLQVKKL